MIRLAGFVVCAALLAGCGGGAGGGGGGGRGTLVTFTHSATLANRVGTRTRLDNQTINGDPTARIVVTESDDGGFVPNPYPPCVVYDAPSGRWEIWNDDVLAAVPLGSDYVVTADPNALVHRVTPANLADAGTATVLDDPRLNNVPNAILIATHNLTPDGVSAGDFLVESPIGFAYDGTIGRWKIFVENGLAFRLSDGDAFNVVVRPPSSTAFRHVVVPGGVVGGIGTVTSVPGGTAIHAMHVATQVGGGPYILNNDVLLVYESGAPFHKVISNSSNVPMILTDEFFVWIP